jgi:hypothetical protein
MIDGRDMYPGELEYDWQEYVIARQEEIEKEVANSSSLIIDELLDQINDKKLRNKIESAIIANENRATYISYNRGIFNGIKRAILLSEQRKKEISLA